MRSELNSLLTIAKNAIYLFLNQNQLICKNVRVYSERSQSSFITLRKQNSLRGCYGTIFSDRPLSKDVEKNAIQAAFYDSRFPPLTKEELSSVRIEVAILSNMESIEEKTEELIIHSLRPHIDGVVFQYKNHKSTFLPYVWNKFPEKEVFFKELKQKAGIEKFFWSEDIQLFRYTVNMLEGSL